MLLGALQSDVRNDMISVEKRTKNYAAVNVVVCINYVMLLQRKIYGRES